MLCLLLGTRVTQYMLETLPEDPVTKISFAFILDSQCTCLTLNPALNQKERRRHNISVRTNRNLLNLSSLFTGINVEFYWAPGSENPTDLSSKVHNNLSKILSSSYYRHGHSSYSSKFLSPDAVLFATVNSGTLRFRGLTSLSNHTSACLFCSTQYSEKIGEVLTLHTELLAVSETENTLKSHNSYNAILDKANDILNPKNCKAASVGTSVGKSVFKVFSVSD